jgi:hypothetical protein
MATAMAVQISAVTFTFSITHVIVQSHRQYLAVVGAATAVLELSMAFS